MAATRPVPRREKAPHKRPPPANARWREELSSSTNMRYRHPALRVNKELPARPQDAHYHTDPIISESLPVKHRVPELHRSTSASALRYTQGQGPDRGQYGGQAQETAYGQRLPETKTMPTPRQDIVDFYQNRSRTATITTQPPVISTPPQPVPTAAEPKRTYVFPSRQAHAPIPVPKPTQTPPVAKTAPVHVNPPRVYRGSVSSGSEYSDESPNDSPDEDLGADTDNDEVITRPSHLGLVGADLPAHDALGLMFAPTQQSQSNTMESRVMTDLTPAPRHAMERIARLRAERTNRPMASNTALNVSSASNSRVPPSHNHLRPSQPASTRPLANARTSNLLPPSPPLSIISRYPSPDDTETTVDKETMGFSRQKRLFEAVNAQILKDNTTVRHTRQPDPSSSRYGGVSAAGKVPSSSRAARDGLGSGYTTYTSFKTDACVSKRVEVCTPDVVRQSSYGQYDDNNTWTLSGLFRDIEKQLEPPSPPPPVPAMPVITTAPRGARFEIERRDGSSRTTGYPRRR